MAGWYGCADPLDRKNRRLKYKHYSPRRSSVHLELCTYFTHVVIKGAAAVCGTPDIWTSRVQFEHIYHRVASRGGFGACRGTSRAESRGLVSRLNQLRQPPPCSSSGSGCAYTHGWYGGAYPLANGKRRASGQEASVLLDCATHCQSRPSLPTFSGVLGRRENSPDQTRIAPVEPYRPVISFWSLPTQTTARWSPV